MFNRDQAAHYLGAMIDGEGWIGEPKGIHNRAIRIANTDPDLISAVIECCDVLGLHYTITHHAPQQAHWAAQQQVHITGVTSFQIVADEVPIRAKKKLDRLKRTIPTFRQPVDIAVLRELYEAGMTQSEVADTMGVGVKRIIFAMKQAKIPRRSHTDRLQSTWRTRRERYGATGRR